MGGGNRMENEKKEGFAHSEAEGQEKREGFTEQETENLSENIAAKNREDTVKKKPKIQWFHINERYMSICRYVIFVFLIVTIVYMLVSYWFYISFYRAYVSCADTLFDRAAVSIFR